MVTVHKSAVFQWVTRIRLLIPNSDKVATLHPKGEGHGEYLVPDVSQFQTWLNPPPADPAVAHPAQP